MSEDLRSLVFCVEAAIASEQANARKLFDVADQLGDHEWASRFRDFARDHQIEAVKLRARLDAHLVMAGEADSP